MLHINLQTYLETDCLLRDLIDLTEGLNCLFDVVDSPRYLEVVLQGGAGGHAVARIGIDALLDRLLLLQHIQLVLRGCVAGDIGDSTDRHVQGLCKQTPVDIGSINHNLLLTRHPELDTAALGHRVVGQALGLAVALRVALEIAQIALIVEIALTPVESQRYSG